MEDIITRRRVVQLLDTLFDDETVRKDYFEIMSRKKSKGCLLDDQWNRTKVQEMIAEVKSNKDLPGQKYGVVEENGEEILILKRVGLGSNYRKILVLEDSFDVLSKVHRELGHEGYRPIYMKLKCTWNFPNRFVNTLKSVCNVCQILKNVKFVTRDFEAYSEANKAWRLNLIKMAEENTYIETPSYILICEDIYSEFLMLRPLKEKTVDEISEQLLKIFLQFGAPKTMSADLLIVYDFLGTVLQKIAKTEPHFSVTIDDKVSALSIRNCDVINALENWVESVECTIYEIDCELGCHVVQKKLNSRLRISNSSCNSNYKAFVPHNLYMKHGELKSSSWDDDIILKMVEKDSIPKTLKRKIKKDI